MKDIRIVIADDHEVLRKGIVSALADQPDMSVVAQTGNPKEVETALMTSQAAILLLDIRMPDFNAPQAVRIFKKKFPNLKILIISAHDDVEYVDSLLEAEVDGYWLKTDTLHNLVEAIREVMKGDAWLSRRVVTIAYRRRQTKQPVSELSERESEVLNLCADGLTNDEIAVRLMVSPRTADRHLANIYDKLGVNNRVEAVRKGIERGYIGIHTTEHLHDKK